MGKASTWGEFVRERNKETLGFLEKALPSVGTSSMDLAAHNIEIKMMQRVAHYIEAMLPPLLDSIKVDMSVVQDQIDEIWEVLNESVQEEA